MSAKLMRIINAIIIYSVGVPSGKDHLGSLRAVLDTTNSVISAQDYDAWGYILENRHWIDPLLPFGEDGRGYKFTGKERDKDLENNYDYFGARYYDSRVANWTSIDPLFEKHVQWTSYNYVLRNPMKLIDPDGKQIDISLGEVNTTKLFNDLSALTGLSFYLGDSRSSLALNFETQMNSDYLTGSQTARNIVVDAVKSDLSIAVQSNTNLKTGVLKGNINLNAAIFDALETAYNEGNFNNLKYQNTFGWGINFIHELIHRLHSDWGENRVMKEENKIRNELGVSDYGTRVSHKEYVKTLGDEYTYIPFSEEAKYALESGRKPDVSEQYIKYKKPGE